MRNHNETSVKDSESNDLHQVRHIIISLSSSGLALFHKSFSGKEIEPDLFSALLTALSLMTKIVGVDEVPEEYQTYQVDNRLATVCQGEYLVGILVSDTPIASEIVQRLERFISTFEEEYGFLLNNWHGDRTFFDHEWADYQLMECMVAQGSNYRLSSTAVESLDSARQIRLVLLIKRFAGDSTFIIESVSDLLVRELIIPKEDAMDYLNELQNKGIIVSASNRDNR